MIPPFRRFVGTATLLVFLLIYLFFALSVGDVLIQGKNGWIQFAYFVVAGLVWILPAGLLIRWMYRAR